MTGGNADENSSNISSLFNIQYREILFLEAISLLCITFFSFSLNLNARSDRMLFLEFRVKNSSIFLRFSFYIASYF